MNEVISDRIIVDMGTCPCPEPPEGMETARLGTGLKYSLAITAEGFDMERDYFRMVITCGGKTLEIPKEEMLYGDDGTWYAGIDTSVLCEGVVSMAVYAFVPDDAFKGGMRTEVWKKPIIYLTNK